MKANSYITIVIVAAFVLIGYLFATTPDTAPTQLPLILAGVGALVAVLNKQGDTDKAVEKSIAVSAENAQSIAAVGAQTGQALEGVNQKVDGHLSGLMHKIEALTQKVTSLESDKAAARVELIHAVDSEARIVAAIVAAVPVVDIVIPPIDEPRMGDKS